MDPNPKTNPLLVLTRLPSVGRKPPESPSISDVDQPPSPPKQPPPPPSLPQLTNPALLSSMTLAITDVAQTRSVLETLGPRPDHETVDNAKLELSQIDTNLSKKLEELVLLPRPTEVDTLEWRAQLAEKEKKIREEAEKERGLCKAILQLDEMHDEYENLLKDAEERLVRIYERGEDEVEEGEGEEPVCEEVVGIWKEGKGMERVDLANRKLRFLPEAFGRIPGLRVLNLSHNQLEVIPDSISGLENLEELNLASNHLETLPHSIGLLCNLKVLNVSSNKLESLPDTICHCRSLLELDVSFNRLTYLPTNIGYELVNLQRLSMQLNKISSLPSSIGEMRSLCHLDAHFNELHGLPPSIGRLTNLEILNLSSNFNDLKELPETFGDLTNLKELDISNNQIHALPYSFGQLDNLIKLNLDQNPLEGPPMEVVKEGVEAVKIFMANRWLDILAEEERKSTLEVQEQAQTGWLTRGTSWLKSYASSVSDNVSELLSPRSPRSPRDPYLDQRL